MRFYTTLIRSLEEVQGYNSLIVHSLVGCNLNCYKCHNRSELESATEYYNQEAILKIIQKNGFMFECIIFSGGEFLLEKTDTIIEMLHNIKQYFKGKIIINSNGSFPEKLKKLYAEELIDGIHLDMKLPYHILNPNENEEIYKKILGMIPDEKLIEKMLESLDFVVRSNLKYSQIRTVKYPILDNEFFDEIARIVESLKIYHNSNVEYKLNKEFVDN